jgi:hypothetical protein
MLRAGQPSDYQGLPGRASLELSHFWVSVLELWKIGVTSFSKVCLASAGLPKTLGTTPNADCKAA